MTVEAKWRFRFFRGAKDDNKDPSGVTCHLPCLEFIRR